MRVVGYNEPDSWDQQERTTHAMEICMVNVFGVQIIQTLCDFFDLADMNNVVLRG